MRKNPVLFLASTLWLAFFFPDQATLSLTTAPRQTPFITGQIIVKVKEPLPAPGEQNTLAVGWNELKENLGVTGIKPFSPAGSATSQAALVSPASAALQNIFLVSYSGPYSVQEVQKLYQKLPQIEYAEPNYLRTIQVTPNDPNFTRQWGLNNTGQNYRNSTHGLAGADVKATLAWGYQNTATGFIIAVVDTGADLAQPDLLDNLTHNTDEIPNNGVDDDHNSYIDDYDGWDFVSGDKTPQDDHGHGTAVSGVIAARGNNGVGVCGLIWQARILPVKVLNSEGSGTSWDIMNGINYAAELGAKVINLSLGGPFGSSFEQEVMDNAWSHGALIVAAMGNNGDNTVFYPAAYNHVFAVGATTSSDQRWSGSCYGNHIAVSAPGQDIHTTGLGGGYVYYTGTSLATPFVSALAALVLAANPTFSPDQIGQRIKETAQDLGSIGWDQYFGYGRIDARQAVHPSPGAPVINSITASSSQSDYFKGDGLVTTGGTAYFNSQSGKGSGQTITLTVAWTADTYDKLIGEAAFGQPQQEDTSGTGGWKIAYTVPTGCGDQTVNLIVQDNEGRRSTATINFIEDNVPPTFTLLINGLNPLPGDLIAALPPLSASYTDTSGLKGGICEFYIDEALKEDGTDASHRFDIYDTGLHLISYTAKTALSDGGHKIGCRLTDNVGNVSALAEIAALQVTSSFAIRNIYNFPNPVTDQTSFSYQLSENSDVDLKVYSRSGQLIWERSFASGGEGGKSGFTRINWNGQDSGGNALPNGVYFYIIRATNDSGETQVAKGKLALLK